MPRMWTKFSTPALVTLLLATGTALAALSVAYTTPSSQVLGVTAPPVIFATGADAGNSNYVNSYANSLNATRYTVTVRGVPEATTTIGELFQLKNVDTNPHTVWLNGTQLVNANILVYKIELYDGATLMGTLDFLAATPTTTMTLPAGSTYSAKVTIQLGSGAGNHNVAATQSITLAITA